MAKRIPFTCLPRLLEELDGIVNPASWHWHPSLGEILGVVSSHQDLLHGRELQICHRAQHKVWELLCTAFLVSLGLEVELCSPNVYKIFKGTSVGHRIWVCKAVWYGQFWNRKVLCWNGTEWKLILLSDEDKYWWWHTQGQIKLQAVSQNLPS